MVRVAIGFFLLFGAVGYEDMMIEMNDPQPLYPFVIKCVLNLGAEGGQQNAIHGNQGGQQKKKKGKK